MSEFARTEKVLGADAMERLRKARVAVFGIGGVGGHVVEALARSGIGALDLVDHDTVALSNLNRQIIALHSTLGQKKVEAARARVLDISPGCRVTAHDLFFLPENAGDFDFSGLDYVVDAIDNVSAKIALILRCLSGNIPVLSCMGTGNKVDPSRLRIGDLSETSVCPLARVMRRELRRRGVEHLKVLYSTEAPRTPFPSPEDDPLRRSTPGSTSFVPSVAGLLLASQVILDLTGARPQP